MVFVEFLQVYVFVVNYCVQMMNVFNEFWKYNILCEVVIVVNGKQFYVYCNVLVVSSLYFWVMFLSNMWEQLENKFVILENIIVEIMEELLNFIYIGSIKIIFFNVKDFVFVFNYFLMISLKEICVFFMKVMLNFFNCLGIEVVVFIFDCIVLRSMVN